MDANSGSYAEQKESKRRKIDKLREGIADEYGFGPPGDGVTDPKKSFVTMRSRRVQTERDMRDTQNMMRRKRRELAAEKAAEPKPRCGDRSSKQQEEKIRSGVPVEKAHQEVCSTLKDEELRIYMSNYHEFIMLQANAMVKAGELDKEEDERRKREKERQKMSEEEKGHRRMFTPTLELIGFEVPHGSGSKIRGVIGQPKTNITAYFGLCKGSYSAATERKWRKFYHEHVKTSSYAITSWPSSSPHESISVGGSSSSVNKKNMDCSVCKVGLIVDMKHGDLLCPNCGVITAGGEGVGMQASFAQQQASQKGAAPYERIAHVSIKWFIVLVQMSLVVGSVGKGSGLSGASCLHRFDWVAQMRQRVGGGGCNFCVCSVSRCTRTRWGALGCSWPCLSLPRCTLSCTRRCTPGCKTATPGAALPRLGSDPGHLDGE